jgi:hypothetical protein
MDDLFKYVTPGMKGVNHISKLSEGILSFAKSRGVTITPHSFSLEDAALDQRDRSALRNFVQNALDADSPIAFLSLNSGSELNLQKWHWITITSATFKDQQLIATATDEGRQRIFDLELWYSTTKMHGGLVYFT